MWCVADHSMGIMCCSAEWEMKLCSTVDPVQGMRTHPVPIGTAGVKNDAVAG